MTHDPEASRARYRQRFNEVLAEAQFDITGGYAARKGPFSLGVTYHDGPGIQILDGEKRPVLTELIRDPEDAVVLLNTLNAKL